jgi:2-oxo-4-hydroxy-4-carboxy--5-ureidoimidazoline (OHCU) decarboxylase/GNAT superfamily N-acetyltransferase
MALDVRDFMPEDRAWAATLLAEAGGGTPHVARYGELLDPLEHEGIVAELDGRPVALLTVSESAKGLEVLSLHSEVRGVGAGTRLLETALRVAVASDAPRLWLVTTSDNVEAIGWYLRRGMHVAGVRPGAVEADRAAVKPEIPRTNPRNGLPIRDSVELELSTDAGDALRFAPFPDIADLDALPPEACAFVLRTLFEDAPCFLSRLAAERPFVDDAGLIGRAQELARTIAEEEQVELLNAHPRIGADPGTVSALSHAEQGYDRPAVSTAPWVAEELEALNEAYERVFGFRFVVFVAGRSREQILPILERALRDEREGELRRGLDDVVDIAADRLAKLRGEVSVPA